MVLLSCSFNLVCRITDIHAFLVLSVSVSIHVCLIPERRHRQCCLFGSSPVRLRGCFHSEAGRLSALDKNVSSAFSRHSQDYFQAHSEIVMHVSVACCVPPSGSDLSSSSQSVQTKPPSNQKLEDETLDMQNLLRCSFF